MQIGSADKQEATYYYFASRWQCKNHIQETLGYSSKGKASCLYNFTWKMSFGQRQTKEFMQQPMQGKGSSLTRSSLKASDSIPRIKVTQQNEVWESTEQFLFPQYKMSHKTLHYSIASLECLIQNTKNNDRSWHRRCMPCA